MNTLKDSALVIVDMLYDFIDGSLACLNSRNAVNAAADFIKELKNGENAEDENEITDTYPVIFVCDNHPADHCSFKGNGGTWPPHCIRETHGSAIHDMLRTFSSEELTFFKGYDRDKEQYSGFGSMNKAGQSLGEVLELMDIKTVYVCGIATEFCVRSTCEDLLDSGYNVILLREALGYTNENNHLLALEEMREEGIRIQ